ncbi:arylsulfatase [Maribacter polysiphoniae]|uniref:Arylsulfatase n=1 Tax=Maribacter polysiphoniae TaxID=429344 RepID=A0A316E4N2_9FLAO|nr:arylsulfatase [Maribacter polysiphoniae]MBD1259897.1 arylsulfatase [Maribacter polysiphoniae]PWK25351.1 arylsulfatase A-like enzyme [Maribacter polysiphoniae]
MKHIHFIFNTLFFLTSVCFGTRVMYAQTSDTPNVIIIITDDQGYGDLGYTGNPHVQTPNIDAFAKEGIRFNNFYVSPVCAPTRSSLMTGRYSLRTGIRDTYNGGAIMASNEVTIAEMLKQADYKTGIFGKWHLGDNYPSRPMDQGFDESLIHLSGGMGQVGDFTTYFQGNRSYFDPVLWHNGKQEAYEGYCSDIFAKNAIDFIEENHQQPFFCYLSFNAPHTPLQVPDSYYQRYKDIDPASGFDGDYRPFVAMSERDKEDARKVYAMVSNIDDNIGRLLQKLESLNIADNTLVVIMTDNGPQQIRYVAGMRGRKGSVYRGGVRVPFFVRYPNKWKGNRNIETIAAHIDVLPTISEVCHVKMPEDRKIDGVNLVPILEKKKVQTEDRSLFFYWTRRYPVLYQNMAVQKGQYKLVGHTDYNAQIEGFELFNIKEDPYEQYNLIQDKKEIAESLKTDLDRTFNELMASENILNQPKILIGSEHENPVFLNRNDAGGERGIWDQEEIYGKWDVSIAEGSYNIKFRFVKPVPKGGTMFLETKGRIDQLKNEIDNTEYIEMTNVQLPKMDCDLIPFYSVGNKKIFPFWVEMQKVNVDQ